MTPSQQRILAATRCEVRSDNLTRQLYATDASLYQVTPQAVAFPKNAEQARALLPAAAEAGLPVIPRGAGTGLVGGAIGDGLVVDLSRFLRHITDLNLQTQTVRVGPGVVLDQLNRFLEPHGLGFGPDVATSSRATLGGMIANNSSGAHVPAYGTTADHIAVLEVVLADGTLHTVEPGQTTLEPQRQVIARLAAEHAAQLRQRMPPGLAKRWPGYGLDRWLRQPGNLNDILAGSEGTLALIVSAVLKLVPLPRRKGLALLFFDSLTEAMQATVELLDLRPAAIEHIDRILLDQTKGQRAFQAARDLLQLDRDPCESILMVEFFDAVDDQLAALEQRSLGRRKQTIRSAIQMNLVWELRKAGLSILTGRPGPAKPVTGIEDTAVRPDQLPAYVDGLKQILDALHLQACFYGHAATGLLHVRPVLNLHSPEDLKKFRQAADEVCALVRQFRGSLTGEHGVGMARTEFLAAQLGEPLLQALRSIKTAFDPNNLFNPGKIVDTGAYRIDTHLRPATRPDATLPFAPVLAFARKDHSFLGNLEQCNGCGGCRKETPTMCPTFAVTGEEIMSTRGRANAIRAVLGGAGSCTGEDPLLAEELEAALGNCLACKACATECPSNVNLALLKTELLHARHRRHGLPWRERIVSAVDTLGRLGCLVPGVANACQESPWLRRLLARFLGITASRPLPAFARCRFDHWFARRSRSGPAARGPVLLWDDTFVRYYEPHIGRAAVTVLETAGFQVLLPRSRHCCGRPAFSQGNLDKVRAFGRHNLELLFRGWPGLPILFLEPSCHSMFTEDYAELRLEGAEKVAERCFLFEQFMDRLLEREPEALLFRPESARLALHVHCHIKSLLDPGFMVSVLQRLPERQVTLLRTGCCGMAGAFGMVDSKYDLSRQVAEPLLRQIAAQPAGTVVAASGASCRHQIQHLSSARPRHTAEILAAALSGSPLP